MAVILQICVNIAMYHIVHTIKGVVLSICNAYVISDGTRLQKLILSVLVTFQKHCSTSEYICSSYRHYNERKKHKHVQTMYKLRTAFLQQSNKLDWTNHAHLHRVVEIIATTNMFLNIYLKVVKRFQTHCWLIPDNSSSHLVPDRHNVLFFVSVMSSQHYICTWINTLDSK